MNAIVSKSNMGAFETIIIENSHLRAVIIPELGGRVWELEDRSRKRQWIWHREKVPLQVSSIGDVYDDVWAGGWEELFPNDAPCQFEGRNLPDHGEWWTMRWDVVETAIGKSAMVVLSAATSIIKASCLKVFSLEAEASDLSVSYQIQSEEDQPFHFLFKQHLALEITPQCRLSLPGGKAQTVDASFSSILSGTDAFDWPYGVDRNGIPTDMRIMAERSRQEREFLYIRDLAQPWCAIEDLHNGASIRMDFDSRQLPYVWLFLTYGGWRNLYTAVLEPCTNMPKDLSEAVRLKQSARIDPGQVFKAKVSVTLAGLEEEGR